MTQTTIFGGARVRTFALLAALVGVLTTGAFVLTASEKRFEAKGGGIYDALPKDALVHFSFAGLKAGEDCKKTAVARIWNDPQMKEFMKPLLEMAGAMIDEQSEGMAKQLGLSVDDMRVLMNGGLTFTVSSVTIDPQQGPTDADVVLTVDMGTNKELVARAGQVLEKHFTEGAGAAPKPVEIAGQQAFMVEGVAPFPVIWTFAGQHLIAGTRTETLAGVLNRMKAKSAQGGLSENPEFAAVWAATGAKKDPMLFAYVDVKRCLALAREASEGAAAGFDGMLSAFGYDAMGGVGYSFSQEGEGFVDRVYMSMPEGPKGVYASMKHSTEPLRSLAMAPKEAFCYSGTRLDIGKIVTGMVDGFASIDPDTAAEIKDSERALDEKLGFSLRQDVLPNIGEEIAFWLGKSPFGGLIPEIIVAIQVRDAAKIQACLDKTIATFGADAPVRRFKFMGKELAYFDSGKLLNAGGMNGPVGAGPRPTWMIEGDFMMLALTPNTLKNWLAARREQRESIGQNQDMMKGLALLKAANPNGGTDSVAYIDIGSAMTMFADTIGHASQCVFIPENIPVDLALFPTTDVFRRNLFGLTATSTNAPTGILSEMYSPMGYIPSLVATVGPLIAFSVGQQRQAAMRATDEEMMPPVEEEPIKEGGEEKKEGGEIK